MELNVGKELAALKRMTVPDLRAKYAEVFGEASVDVAGRWSISI